MLIATAIATALALAPSHPPTPHPFEVSDDLDIKLDAGPELVRAEVIPADDSTALVAYDADDNVVADIVISAEGIQASIDGVFIDAEVAPDGALVVRCHGTCTETERAAAAARLATVGLAVEAAGKTAGKTAGMWCAIGIASTAAACVGSSGLLCGVGFAATACACMKEVVINGTDICDV
jgi:hypothetical protein